MGNIGIFQLGIVCLIVVLLFGSKKLRNLGADLGFALKNFKQSFSDGPAPSSSESVDVTHIDAHPQDKV